MDDKFKGKYRIAPARLACWDYGSEGLYYITICTGNRVHYFGDIVDGSIASIPETLNCFLGTQDIACLNPTAIGYVAYRNWLDIPNHFPFIELDKFVIMPNHLHGILLINKPNKTDWQTNKFGVQSQNLASVIRGYKASVKAFATTNNIEFSWQSRYYDHIIRNEKEYLNIAYYISDNSNQWLLNGDNKDDLYKS